MENKSNEVANLIKQSFKIGNTSVQIEVFKKILSDFGGKYLITLPRTKKFINEGKKFDFNYKFIRKTEDIEGDGFYVSNTKSLMTGEVDYKMFLCVFCETEHFPFKICINRFNNAE